MPRFDLGKLVMTSGIQNIINEKPSYQYELVNYLNRYLNEDWGDLCDNDKQMNEDAIKNKKLVIAEYTFENGKKEYQGILKNFNEPFTKGINFVLNTFVLSSLSNKL